MMAQGGVTTFLKKVGDGIDSMSIRGVDRRYIDMPKNPWQLIVRGNVNQSVVNMKTSGSISGEEYMVNPRLRTSLSQYAGVWIGYRGYGLGYTTNVEELMESPTFSDPDISDEEWDKWFYENLHITHVGNTPLTQPPFTSQP